MSAFIILLPFIVLAAILIPAALMITRHILKAPSTKKHNYIFLPATPAATHDPITVTRTRTNEDGTHSMFNEIY